LKSYTLQEALASWQWYGLWALLFLNTTAGIAIISQAAPMAEETTHVSAATAAGLVGAIAVANGLGRFVWAWLSDLIGRRTVFLIMFPLQALLFAVLPSIDDFAAFATLSCLILTCYGGGFGTLPAFTADRFGAQNVGPIYGLMLTAWSCAGVFGPMLIAAVRDRTGEYADALYVIAALMLASTIIPVVLGEHGRKSIVTTTISEKA
jgi:OFA family oxalate/formate antiporter-like MFS transporter